MSGFYFPLTISLHNFNKSSNITHWFSSVFKDTWQTWIVASMMRFVILCPKKMIAQWSMTECYVFFKRQEFYNTLKTNSFLRHNSSHCSDTVLKRKHWKSVCTRFGQNNVLGFIFYSRFMIKLFGCKILHLGLLECPGKFCLHFE